VVELRPLEWAARAPWVLPARRTRLVQQQAASRLQDRRLVGPDLGQAVVVVAVVRPAQRRMAEELCQVAGLVPE